MSDEGQRQWFNTIAPTQSAVPGIGITKLATSVVAAAHDLNAFPDLFGKLILLIASGGKVWVSTSADGATPINSAIAAGATVAAGTSAPVPVPIGDGQVLAIRLEHTKNRFLHVQADAGTPALIIFPSSPPRLSDLAGGP